MRPITADTPRKDVRIGGVILKCPTPFAEGDPLTANEAAAINQTYCENIGNNFRSAVEKAKRQQIAGSDDAEKMKAVTKAQLDAFDVKLEAGQATLDTTSLQKSLDGVVSEYQMGVRRTSSAEPVDPVEKEARSMAKDALKKALQKRGIKLNTVTAEWYDREIDKLLAEGNEKGAAIRKNAARRVQLANQAAVDDLEGLDLSGSQKPAEPESEAQPAAAE